MSVKTERKGRKPKFIRDPGERVLRLAGSKHGSNNSPGVSFHVTAAHLQFTGLSGELSAEGRRAVKNVRSMVGGLVGYLR